MTLRILLFIPLFLPSIAQAQTDSLYYEYHPAISKETVILEAGARSDARVWRLVQRDLLAEGFGVLAYDRHGLGRSAPIAGPRDGRTIARDLNGLIKQLGITNRLVLVGHSMGGIYHWIYALMYPEDVKALVLVDTPAQEWENELRKCLSEAQILERELTLDRMRERLPEASRKEYESSPENYTFILSKPGVAIPVGIVVGGRQQWPAGYPASCLTESWVSLQSNYKNALQVIAFEISPRSGHQVPLQDSKLVVQTVKRVTEF